MLDNLAKHSGPLVDVAVVIVSLMVLAISLRQGTLAAERKMPMSAHERLVEFIQKERGRFETRHNNMFAFAFSEITRYLRYLDIITARFRPVGQEFVENTRAIQKSIQPGTHPITADQMKLHLAAREIQDRLHLEIESYYLFAKILLDKVARAVEFAFGTVRSISLDSHDLLEKHIVAYAESKGIQLDPKLLAVVRQCKQDISDHRDYQIAHEKSPRTTRGTMFSLDGSEIRMSLNKLYSTEKDKQVETIAIDELAVRIDRYLNLIVDLAEANTEKFALIPAAQPDDNGNEGPETPAAEP